MGDIGGVDGNGVVMEERFAYANPDPSSISEEIWDVAEEYIQEVINCIRPTLDSDEKRKDVIDYVQNIIRCSVGFEVFPYGSVPLKTYLPDGDIDLTAIYSTSADESWASDVLSVLRREELNENAEYEVKDTQFIDAEVKLVKCLVQNIVIDISFNQLGGLGTLCFLEQVDRLVGKNHVFKLSIILIKAWCYYESRILGAHHGLISTYALETMVLYIFQLFHSSLNGPLAVLYRFLDYLSKFDWDNYCISLNGPVCKSSLPDIVVEKPQNGGNDPMLSEEFLRNCMEMFSVPSRGSETNSRSFCPKYLNIIDPLKVYNNLGRSVHRGNFYRIRSAFKHGARKLGQILSLPRDEIADEMKKFFCNTLEAHDHNNRFDMQDYSLPFSAEGSGTLYSLSSAEAFSEDDTFLRSSTGDFENGCLVMEEKCALGESGRSSRKVVSSLMPSELSYSMDGPAISGNRVYGDAYELAAYTSLDFWTLNGTSECSLRSNYTDSFLGQYGNTPQFYLGKSSTENGHFNQSDPSDGVEAKSDPDPCLEQREDHLDMVNTYQFYVDNMDGFCSCSSAVSSPKTSILDSLSLDFRERDSASAVDVEPLNPLADLSGEYDSHVRSLLYGQSCHGFALSASLLSNSPMSPSQFQTKDLWDTVCQSMPLRQSSSSQMNSSTVFAGAPASIAPPTFVFASEEKHKTRGTGTYLPIMNFVSKDRPPQGRSRNKTPRAHGQLQRQTCSNGFVPAVSETNTLGKGGRDVLHAWCPVQACKKSGVICQSSPNAGDTRAHSLSNSSCRIEFGSLGQLANEVISGTFSSNGSTSSTPTEEQDSTSNLSIKEERVADQSFRLKNEEEFPPLSL